MLLSRTTRNVRRCCRFLATDHGGVDVSTKHNDKTVILTLRNEGKMNCMTENMATVFQGLVRELPLSHPKARCLVVTGHSGSFAAGADLAWLEERGRTEQTENVKIMKEYYGYFTPLLSTKIPTIAAINGAAMGAGFCLAMLCDLRITSDDSKLGANFVKLGISPGMAGSYTIPNKLPNQVANALILTGQTFSGKEAREMGVVLKSVPTKSDVLPESLSLAQHIVENTSPNAITETLHLLRASQIQNLQSQLELEAEAQAKCFATRDYEVALAAVRAKKMPVF